MIPKADIERLSEYTENTRWLLENMDALRAKLPDRYVAVSDAGKRVLDAATLDELMEKIAKSGKASEECAIDFVSREVYALIV